MKKMADILGVLKERYGTDAPILTSDIEDAFPNMPRRTLFYRVDRLVDSGALERYENGVYYIPSSTLAGKSALDPAKVVERKYLKNENGVCGYWSGAALDNGIGLSTQVPARLEVVTNNTGTAQRTIKVGGWLECVVKKAPLPVDNDNVRACQVLDVLGRKKPAELDNEQRMAFARLADGVPAAKLYEMSLAFPQKTTRRITEGVACGLLA